MSVLSIQSTVASGHVGNGAALFALQRLGIETQALSTVTLAHHPARGAWQGRIANPDELSVLLGGLEAVGELARCDAVLSGYLGDAALGAVLLDAVARVKAAHPGALYCCDPVMGESNTGFYVRAGIAEFFRDQALPRADILIPNLFELAWLAEGASGNAGWDLARALTAARRLLAPASNSGRPRLVVVKGVRRKFRGRREIGALAVTSSGAWHASCPEVDALSHGAGDLFSALFLGHRLKGRSIPRALTLAVSSLHAVMVRTAARATHEDATGELALIAAQDRLVSPKRLFKAVKIG
jgi:pyridoxine kinase